MNNLQVSLKGAQHTEGELKTEILDLQDSLFRLQARLASDSRYRGYKVKLLVHSGTLII